MKAGRWVLFVTVLVVGGLAVLFLHLSKAVAGQAEAPVTALAAVAAVGTGVWAALPHGKETSEPAAPAIAKRTGPTIARGRGSRAISGVKGSGIAKRTGATGTDSPK